MINSDLGHEGWLELDYAYMLGCHAILMTGLWSASRGSIEELAFADALGMPVMYLDGPPEQQGLISAEDFINDIGEAV
jgi:hypothetical protein